MLRSVCRTPIGGIMDTSRTATMKGEEDLMKREPSSVDVAATAAAQKRDHLRALLDRARGNRSQPLSRVSEQTSTDEPSSNATNPSPAKRVISLKSRSKRPEPPCLLTTPRGKERTPLLPIPSADYTEPSRPAHAEYNGALLPTPNATANYAQYNHAHHHAERQQQHFVNASEYSFAAPDVPPVHMHYHPPAYHQTAPPPPILYPSMPLHTPSHPCACAHGFSAAGPHHSNAHYPHYTHGPAPPPLYHSHHIQAATMSQAYDHAQHHAKIPQYTASTYGGLVHSAPVTASSPTMSVSTSSTEGMSDGKPSVSHSADRKHLQAAVDSNHNEDQSSSRKQSKTDAPSERAAVRTQHGLEDYEDNELHSDFSHAVHMLIPDDSFGCLVGPRGQIMKEINAASGCTLSVREPHTFPGVDRLLVLRVYGTPKGICFAQRAIIERIREHRERKGDLNYTRLRKLTLASLDEAFIPSAVSTAIESSRDTDDTPVVTNGQLKWLIHRDDVGKIMGSEGVILRAIARDTNTTLKISTTKDLAPGAVERTVTIKGETDAIEKARTVIESKAGGRPETHSGKLGQYFVFPSYAAGFLIGPQGSRMKQLRDDTGARVQIPAQQDIPLGYVNRTLHIQGTKKQIDHATSRLKKWLEAFADLDEARDSANEDEIAVQLILPSRICGFLLDQRGRLIREITEKSGAHSRMLPPLDDEHRICVLYGDMLKVLRAERLILQFIAGDAIANKRASSTGTAPRKRKHRVDDSDDDNVSEEGNMTDDDLEEQQKQRRKRRATVGSSGRIVQYSEPTERNGPTRLPLRRETLRGGCGGRRGGSSANSGGRGTRKR